MFGSGARWLWEIETNEASGPGWDEVSFGPGLPPRKQGDLMAHADQLVR
jgi:hypothetical protein